MPARGHRLGHGSRDLALDCATAGLAVALCVLAATALNRLPYPGAQHYRARIGAMLTAPLLSDAPTELEIGGEPVPHITTGNESE
jgi:hypothetical protein